MRRFVVHLLIFCSVLLATIFSMLSFADGYSDAYYLKVSSPKKTNLIIGTSKAAQGLQPQVLSELLGKDFFNYSFSMYASPYGDVYLNSIKAKLDTSYKDNIFIVTLDTWSLSSATEDPNDYENFRERQAFLGKGIDVNANPNFKYLLNCFENKYFNIFLKDGTAFLHDNGWLEVSLNEDEEAVKRRTVFTIDTYKEYIGDYHFSELRYSYLLKTIEFLNQYGQVHLVRLPIHPDLMDIEQIITPNFNMLIETAIDSSEAYLDLTDYNQGYEYTDGVHLNQSSGEQISHIIAKAIIGE